MIYIYDTNLKKCDLLQFFDPPKTDVLFAACCLKERVGCHELGMHIDVGDEDISHAKTCVLSNFPPDAITRKYCARYT